MKKRSWLMCIALVLSLTIALGSTLAYLTDTDADVNTMTLGNVKIEQIEKERVEQSDNKTTKDNVKDFKQDKPLYPYVGEVAWADDWQEWPEGGSNQLFTDKLKNVVDKFVFVENTGKSNAYVRTWFAFEMGSLTYEDFDKLIGINRNATHWKWEVVSKNETIDGNTYVVMCATYLGNAGTNKDEHKDGVLPAGATTRPSLLQVYLDKTATNADVEAIDGNKNGKYDILVLSQAIQADGFTDAETALEEGFTNAVPDFTVSEPEVNYPEAKPETDPNTGVITLELDPDEPVQITDLKEPLVIEGEGTVVLKGAEVEGESGESGLTVAPGSKVTLMVTRPSTLTGGTGADGITVGEGAEVVITGSSTLYVEGNGGKDEEGGTTSGHGIGGEGDIVIKDLGDLTARGHGEHGTGIGGNSKDITIENTHITSVTGGRSKIYYPESSNYYKEADEGAPAIGSLEEYAEINLNGVVIDEVVGGSKAAAIGTRFWNSATINITDCEIKNAVGGNSSAAIGASRPGSGDVSHKYVNISIHNSKITAVGGVQAAGIGSGYDTYCHSVDIAYRTTINITGNSVINATGGKFGAGIGTGYHSGHLAGKIESSVVVNAQGDIHYKDSDGDDGVYSYTIAQDVGFGMIDLNREGKDNTCTFDYKGTIITVPEAFIPPATE